MITFNSDYISFSFPKSELKIFQADIMDCEIKELDKGFRGYTKSAFLLFGGRVGWSDNRDEIHFDLPSQALSYYFESTWDVVRLINFITSVGGKISRYDFCFDVEAEHFVSVDVVEKAVTKRDFVSRAVDFRVVEEFTFKDGVRVSKGKTVYVGSRKSQKMLRVYDKAKEQGVYEQDKTRFELMCRDETAISVCQELVNSYYQDEVGDKIRETMLGIMRAYCDFVDGDSDTNSSRKIMLNWWKVIVQDVKKIRLVITKTVLTIEKAVAWVEKQVAPTLALIKRYYGSSGMPVIWDIIEKGNARMSEKHHRILADCVS